MRPEDRVGTLVAPRHQTVPQCIVKRMQPRQGVIVGGAGPDHAGAFEGTETFQAKRPDRHGPVRDGVDQRLRLAGVGLPQKSKRQMHVMWLHDATTTQRLRIMGPGRQFAHGRIIGPQTYEQSHKCPRVKTLILPDFGRPVAASRSPPARRIAPATRIWGRCTTDAIQRLSCRHSDYNNALWSNLYMRPRGQTTPCVSGITGWPRPFACVNRNGAPCRTTPKSAAPVRWAMTSPSGFCCAHAF